MDMAVCSAHGKKRSLQNLSPDGVGGFLCAPGSECKGSGYGVGKGGVVYPVEFMGGMGGKGGKGGKGSWGVPWEGEMSSKKRKKAAAQANWAPDPNDPDAGLPVMTWFEVGMESSLVLEQGFTTDAVALTYDKKQHAFRDSHSVLQDLVEDISKEVQLTHDPNKENFADVSAAIQAAGGEGDCVCIATCPSRGRWGVGQSYGWKNGENAAKLALALSLCKVNLDGRDLDELAATYPAFGGLMQEAGMIAGFEGYNPTPAKMAKIDGAIGLTATTAGLQMGGGGPPVGIPYHSPTWIVCPEGMPPVFAELPPETVCMNNDGKSKGLYGFANGVLKEFGLDPTGADLSIEFHDDPEWTLFPEIGKALAAAGAVEDWMQIAVCRLHGCWGCGLGSKWLSRESAAKASLALMLAQRVTEVDTTPNFTRYPNYLWLLSMIPTDIGAGEVGEVEEETA